MDYTTLEDAEVATLIDALAAYEQRLISEGMTGKDARSALNKINSHMRPSTWGLRITYLNV